MNPPLVSVVCLCYNHKKFVREAIQSVLDQTHASVQLIVVDDASTDGSVDVIKQIKSENPQIEVLLLDNNVGNCIAFNKGLARVKGEYVIDFATDDVLLPNRVVVGLKALEEAGDTYGVQFSDAEYINERGKFLYLHADKYPHASIPQGDVYVDIIQRYFVCSPTVMMRKSVIDALGGFDESLYYEDFDFLIRSARITKFHYTSQVLMKRRIVRRALSGKQFTFFSRHAQSTYDVCVKIMRLNKNEEERKALAARIRYELLLNLRLLNFGLVIKYIQLLLKNRSGY